MVNPCPCPAWPQPQVWSLTLGFVLHDLLPLQFNSILPLTAANILWRPCSSCEPWRKRVTQVTKGLCQPSKSPPAGLLVLEVYGFLWAVPGTPCRVLETWQRRQGPPSTQDDRVRQRTLITSQGDLMLGLAGGRTRSSLSLGADTPSNQSLREVPGGAKPSSRGSSAPATKLWIRSSTGGRAP